MTIKLRKILLIDDDDITNFLHQSVLNKAQVAQNIEVADTVTEALNILECPQNYQESQPPELIFLDLNMPGLNGWDFIDAYKKIKDDCRLESVIVVLTTSANPDDNIKANAIAEISEFRHKPLTVDMVKEIIHKYFNQN